MTTAILMASGMGTRMRPLTKSIPKPLIEVGGRPMIETIIDGLELAGVSEIYVVIGYLGEQFEYLTEKYENITLIRNDVYEMVNNISSVYAARDVLLKGDCFICEADLYVSDPTVFCHKSKMSCYYGKFIEGHSDDWVFDLDENNIITRVGKVGDDRYNMTGVAYFKERDARILRQFIETEYGKPGYETLFWDDVVDRHISDFQLRIRAVNCNQIIEIDTVNELAAIRSRVAKKEV